MRFSTFLQYPPPMKTLLLILSVFLSVNVSALAAERPEIGPMVDAFAGPKNEEVWIARIGPKSADEVIMQITGIDHEWNGKIFKCSVETTTNDKRYVTMLDKQRYVLLILRGETSGELYLPREKSAVRVYYSKELSRQGNPEAFLTDYLEQSKQK